MRNYENDFCGYGVHTVEVDLQRGSSKVTLTKKVGGNACGFSVVEAAVGAVYEDAPVYDYPEDDGAYPGQACYLAMKDADGDEVKVFDADEEEDEWVKAMVVGVRITGFATEKRPKLKEGGAT